ncbi:HD-GYP domain-containing protein [Fusibacter sp. 3D3]|uniref:HD-GYP domain-containing protein n=1 Tax=Fusibacter sp. 3D3 TaxID=1048380 RepID=UPI000853E2B8|nr:HD-GYP domain-containing protein [Fusibacter sp. 3D3]GAU76715.1 HD-GYP domain [Fusibacter sp. 3D3]
MVRERKRVLAAFVIIIFFIGLSVLGLWGYASYQSTILYSYVEDVSSKVYKNNDFYVEIVAGEGWQIDGTAIGFGAQYDGYFYNKKGSELVDWSIDFVVPEESYIDSAWNGVFEKKENQIHLHAVDYNTNLSHENAITFGLVMYTSEPFTVNEIKVSGYWDRKMTSYPIFGFLMFLLVIVLVALITYLISDFRMKNMRIKQDEYKEIILQSLKTFANIIDAKDAYTKGHSLRVAKYAQEISRRMGKSVEEQERIFQISLLHDIGKIAVDDSILKKPGRLTPEELEKAKMHASTGGDILKDFTKIDGIEDGARFHHESFDGKGYPCGLAGEAIPECARIICVADAFDAMDSDRCYRNKLSREIIFKELENCSGIQFDGEIVKHMIQIIEDGFSTEDPS